MRREMAGTKNIIGYVASSATIVALAFALSCKDSNPVGPDGSPSDVVFPPDSVSYSQHVQVLFNQTCALPSCHSSGEGSDRVKLDNYQNLRFGVNGLPMVIPGSPDQSELVLRIEGRTGDRMPINRNPLNQNQINGIRAWIVEGAKDN
jgi:Planctomycete cytochrome C